MDRDGEWIKDFLHPWCACPLGMFMKDVVNLLCNGRVFNRGGSRIDGRGVLRPH